MAAIQISQLCFFVKYCISDDSSLASGAALPSYYSLLASIILLFAKLKKVKGQRQAWFQRSSA